MNVKFLLDLPYNVSGSVIWFGWLEYTKHRHPGPASISDQGNITFAIRDKFSRPVGPAIISANGSLFYADNGLSHRTDGPAVIHSNGDVEYWVNGYQIDSTEFFLKYGSM